jgi:predicted signal transduction protein with EAL and GGDEF domain
MYQAKEKGRGRWHLFSDIDQAREQADARVLWREQIAEALRQDRFELRIQPILEIATNRIRYHEALLRMRESAPDADLFINLRFETADVGGKMKGSPNVELFAYATAVRFRS